MQFCIALCAFALPLYQPSTPANDDGGIFVHLVSFPHSMLWLCCRNDRLRLEA